MHLQLRLGKALGYLGHQLTELVRVIVGVSLLNLGYQLAELVRGIARHLGLILVCLIVVGLIAGG